MTRSATIKIDAKKLRRCIELAGYAMLDASAKLGHGRTYLSQVYARGTITVACAKLIENELGIFPKEYIWHEPTPEPDVKQDEPDVVGAFTVADEILADLKDIKQLLTQLVEVWK